MPVLRWWWRGFWGGLTGDRPRSETFVQGLLRLGKLYAFVVAPLVAIPIILVIADAIWRLLQ